MRARLHIALALVSLLLPPLAALAADVAVGQRIELKADKPAGVPLHSAPRPSMVGRAPDRSAATVIGPESVSPPRPEMHRAHGSPTLWRLRSTPDWPKLNHHVPHPRNVGENINGNEFILELFEEESKSIASGTLVRRIWRGHDHSAVDVG